MPILKVMRLKDVQQIRELLYTVVWWGQIFASPHKRLLESFATWRAVSSASINHSENLGNFTNAMVLLVQCRLKGSEQKWAREGGEGGGVFDTRPVTEIKAKNAWNREKVEGDWLSKTLFTWSGVPRSSGVGFFCFVSPRAWTQKKPTPLDRVPPLHVNGP